MITIGIVGNGFVGSATQQLLCPDINILCYDINPKLCYPLGTTINDLNQCSLIFVSVPTPMNIDGSCHTQIVERVVQELHMVVDENKTAIIVRSTVPIGTADKLKCFFMPEFLTEKNFIKDFKSCEKWIFGVYENSNFPFKDTITTLFKSAKDNGCIDSNELVFLSNMEAETIKYMRNTFLATKVGFANEWATFCNKKGINYENVRVNAFSDKRIGLSHTDVPGHDGKLGFGGTCLPNDIASSIYQIEQQHIKPFILAAVQERNDKNDRWERDWMKDEGRAVI